MKKRKGFVSNSSSSSFVCAVCGDTEGGYDVGYSECEMFECECGHVIHESCAELDEDGRKMLDEDRCAIPSKYCPACQLKVACADDVLSYLLHKHKISKDDVLKEMAGKYKEMKDFYEERDKKQS